MAEFMFELLSEEIPAGLQQSAAADLARLVTDGLAKIGLSHGEVAFYSTPRRLTLVIDDVADQSPDIREERKGPRVGAPEKAVEGFLRSVGLHSLDDCKTVADKKGEFYVAINEKPGLAANDIFAALLPEIICTFPWPKSMRWGAGRLRWVRPLHSIIALLNGGVIEFEVEGLTSGANTVGHRFLAPKSFKVKNFNDYEARLKEAFVLLRPIDRREAIRDEALKIAQNAGLELVEDDGLLSETAGLVEWPKVLMGTFEEEFLSVPPEVLITSMKKHQKCFSLRNPQNGSLANRFLLVSNLMAKDKGKAITGGNERVIRARLSDAAFFWDQDRKHRLDDNLDKLDYIIFHEKLGTQGERIGRVRALARDLAARVGADPQAADRAAELCKADLVTEMVGEFPDLQGLMGRYYGQQQGESDDVATALEEHYMPKGVVDEVPQRPVSIAVALADKLDTLVGFWAIKETPTGSKDPFALRRAALGIIRILLENNIRLDLFHTLAKPFARVQGHIEQTLIEEQLQELEELADHGFTEYAIERFQREVIESEEEIADRIDDLMRLNRARAIDLLAFFADRLKVYMRDRGARYDLIDAVYALGGQDDLLMIVKRVEALGIFLDSEDGGNLLTGIRRAINILAKEEKKDKASYDDPCEEVLLVERPERDLYRAIVEMEREINSALGKEDFIAAMAAFARLRAPVDEFFNAVTVNSEDRNLRRNRLRLLALIRRASLHIADFSKIEG